MQKEEALYVLTNKNRAPVPWCEKYICTRRHQGTV